MYRGITNSLWTRLNRIVCVKYDNYTHILTIESANMECISDRNCYQHMFWREYMRDIQRTEVTVEKRNLYFPNGFCSFFHFISFHCRFALFLFHYFLNGRRQQWVLFYIKFDTWRWRATSELNKHCFKTNENNNSNLVKFKITFDSKSPLRITFQ